MYIYLKINQVIYKLSIYRFLCHSYPDKVVLKRFANAKAQIYKEHKPLKEQV
jgi:hypothetical protein